MAASNRETRPPVRVVLSQVPPMVAVFVKNAVNAQEPAWVVESHDPGELDDLVAKSRADVVIVPNERSGVAQRHRELLRQNPHLKILTIAAVSRGADLYELRLLGANVGEQDVVAAIRGVMAASTEIASQPTRV